MGALRPALDLWHRLSRIIVACCGTLFHLRTPFCTSCILGVSGNGAETPAKRLSALPALSACQVAEKYSDASQMHPRMMMIL